MDPAGDRDGIERLYERARRLSPAARAEFLDAAGLDPELRAEIESLLASAEEAERMFESLLEVESRVDYGLALTRGARVGEYRVLERLGSGGMGTVFLAERTVLGIGQRVALKIVRPGRADARTKARLLEEGRVLARLGHPGIARFIDGGVTVDGLAYIAMEYVEGEPLLDHCDRQALTVDERLGLFLDVCEAVQYAHQQLVVHRDLKPAHILVERDGRIRLLDFGVARLIEQGASGAGSGATDHWITPSHASPEQIRGEGIGTASDQYALGVILYELLTGRPPYRLSGHAPSEVERIVCDEGVPTPSEVTQGRLSRRLAGDLDNIVRRAMAVEPARRYASVAQFADDLRDHQVGRPVRARPDTWRYRAGRYVRRNRTAVVAGAVILVSLASGAALATWQAAVATAERDRAREALEVSQQVRAFVTDLFWSDRAPGSRGIRSPAELLERGLVQAREPSLDPAVRAELLDVLGWAHVTVKEYTTAERLLRQAVELRRQMQPEGAAGLAYTMSRLSGAERRLGWIQQSERTAREALAMQERLLGPAHPHVAETLLRLGSSVALQDRHAEAVALKRRALDISRRALDPADPAVVGSMHTLAGSLEAVGSWEEAERLYREALSLRASQREDDPLVGDAALTLGNFLAARGRTAEAESLYARALRLHRAAYDPQDARLAWPMVSLGGLLVQRGEHEQGLELLRQALEIERYNWGDDHLSTASTMASLASALRRAGRSSEAESLYWSVLAIERKVLGPRHPQTAGSLLDIGRLRIQDGDLLGAEAPMLEGLSIRRERGGLGVARTVGLVAELYQLRGEYERAEALLEEGLELVALGHDETGQVRDDLLRRALELYSAWGKPDEVERVRKLAAPELVQGG